MKSNIKIILKNVLNIYKLFMYSILLYVLTPLFNEVIILTTIKCHQITFKFQKSAVLYKLFYYKINSNCFNTLKANTYSFNYMHHFNFDKIGISSVGSCLNCTSVQNCTRGQNCTSSQNCTKILLHEGIKLHENKIALRYFCTSR